MKMLLGFKSDAPNEWANAGIDPGYGHGQSKKRKLPQSERPKKQKKQ
jgi:hypothetical protein